MDYEGWKTSTHTPPHLLLDDTWYLVSASMWRSLDWFKDENLAASLAEAIEEHYARCGWDVELYVIMPNHYHAVVKSKRGSDLPVICKRVHGRMAALMRKRLETLGSIGAIAHAPEQYFNNYWDTCLNTEREWNEAMEYVRTNPVRAGLARTAEEYQFWGPQRRIRQ